MPFPIGRVSGALQDGGANPPARSEVVGGEFAFAFLFLLCALGIEAEGRDASLRLGSREPDPTP